MQDDLVALLGMEVVEAAKLIKSRSPSEEPKTDLVHDEFHMEFLKSGLGIVASLDTRVKAIQLHAAGYEQYNEYTGGLPEGLSFSDSRRMVRTRLGPPSTSGGGTSVPVLGTVLPWERFHRNSHLLHVQYAQDEKSITMISLLALDFLR